MTRKIEVSEKQAERKNSGRHNQKGKVKKKEEIYMNIKDMKDKENA